VAVSSSALKRFQKVALRYYRRHARDLPWRKTRDPYRILVSEIMLQQTQVDRVIPKYEFFVKRFPSLRSLACARFVDVLRAWIGLGYNGRALRLWRCARIVVDAYDGKLPRTPQMLALLPGVGSYTAAAVAAIAFDAQVPVIDTNVKRVITRVLTGCEHISSSRVRALAAAALPTSSASQWAQALMDIGARFCKSAPRCKQCPLATTCAHHSRAQATTLRRKASRAQPAYAGSQRFYRGWVMRTLSGAGTLLVSSLSREVNNRFGISDRAWFNDLLGSLARDGLVRIDGRRVSLP
jgi:A/G-specific adenine glycosylase